MYRIFKRGCALLATLALVAGFTRTAFTQAKYTPGAPFPEPDEELYGIAAGGKMYVIGGFAGGKAAGMVYEYDPSTDKWTKKKPMARPAHHEALAELNGKIYVFGGYMPPPPPSPQNGWMPIDNAWEYDPVADTWTALPPMPAPRGSGIAFEVGGKFYVIGGAMVQPGAKSVIASGATGRAVTTNDMYDPATKKWTTRQAMPTARNHNFGGVVGGKIYVIGGRMGAAGIGLAINTDVVEEYDPVKDTWGGAMARMPTPRSGGGYATYGGRIYVAGGENNTDKVAGAFKAVEAFDPVTNRWFPFPSMPNPRHGVATAVLGNKLHLVSGNITSGGAGDPKIYVHSQEHDVIELTDCRGVTTSCP
jgi:N-acetylneuraminic acid mutarotase